MNNNRSVKGLFVVSGATLLAACGGGGSGSGDGGSGVSLTLDTENYAEKRIAISAESNVENIVGLYDGIAQGLTLIGEVEETLPPEATEQSGSINCAGGGTLDVSIIEREQRTDQTLRFSDCQLSTTSYGVVLLNGSYEARFSITGETEASISETYSIIGELQDTGEPLQIKGRSNTDLATDSANGIRLTNSIEVFEVKIGSTYSAITNGEIRINGSDSSTEFSISGKVLGSDIGGYIQLSTPTSVIIPNNESCPTEGIIRIASEGSAEVRYGSSAGGTASAVAVWIDGQVAESYSDCNAVGFTSGY